MKCLSGTAPPRQCAMLLSPTFTFTLFFLHLKAQSDIFQVFNILIKDTVLTNNTCSSSRGNKVKLGKG